MKPSEVEAAKRICAAPCPARAECLFWSLVESEGWGVWGGLTKPERTRALAHFGGDVDKVMAALHAGVLDAIVSLDAVEAKTA